MVGGHGRKNSGHAEVASDKADPSVCPTPSRLAANSGAEETDMRVRMTIALIWLDKLLRWYIILLMAILVVLTFMQVLARYAMHFPATGTDQMARIASVWLTFMGAAVAVGKNKNIRIEIIEKYLPEAVRNGLHLAFDLLLIVLLAVLSVKAYEVMKIGATQDIVATPFTYAAIYSSIFAGSVIMLLFLLVRTLERFKLIKFGPQKKCE